MRASVALLACFQTCRVPPMSRVHSFGGYATKTLSYSKEIQPHAEEPIMSTLNSQTFSGQTHEKNSFCISSGLKKPT
jgi:hypothetical protein